MQLSLNCQEFFPVMAPISPTKKAYSSLQIKETHDEMTKVNTEDNVTVCSSNADTLSQVDS